MVVVGGGKTLIKTWSFLPTMDKATAQGRERANAALSALALAENAVYIQDVCAYIKHLESELDTANRRAAQFEHSYRSVKTVSDKTMEKFTKVSKATRDVISTLGIGMPKELEEKALVTHGDALEFASSMCFLLMQEEKELVDLNTLTVKQSMEKARVDEELATALARIKELETPSQDMVLRRAILTVMPALGALNSLDNKIYKANKHRFEAILSGPTTVTREEAYCAFADAIDMSAVLATKLDSVHEELDTAKSRIEELEDELARVDKELATAQERITQLAARDATRAPELVPQTTLDAYTQAIKDLKATSATNC